MKRLNLSNKPKCKGSWKLGPDDPSINWNNCVGFKRLKYGYYIGEFENGYLQGQGIEFQHNGEIYVGSFKEDRIEGSAIVFIEVETFYRIAEDPNRRKSWTVNVEFIEGEVDSSSQFVELRTKR